MGTLNISGRSVTYSVAYELVKKRTVTHDEFTMELYERFKAKVTDRGCKAARR